MQLGGEGGGGGAREGRLVKGVFGGAACGWGVLGAVVVADLLANAAGLHARRGPGVRCGAVAQTCWWNAGPEAGFGLRLWHAHTGHCARFCIVWHNVNDEVRE